MTVGSLNVVEADTEFGSLRRTFGCFPSGVVAVCAAVDGAPAGLVASTFVPVSLDPPLAAFCVQHSSTTWPKLRQSPRLGISSLSAGQQIEARRLAGKGERFAGLTVSTLPDGAVFLDESAAVLECSIRQEHVAGDHSIVVLSIHRQWADPAAAPLVFHGSAFHQLVPA